MQFQRFNRLWLGFLVVSQLYGWLACRSLAHAQVRLGGLTQQHPRVLQRLLSPTMNGGKPARLVVKNSALRESVDHVAIGQNFSLVKASNLSDLEQVFWAPPKRLLMDQAKQWIHLNEFKQRAMDLTPPIADAGTGAGVVVGVVDGGIDFTHPDLQNADGSTRVAWFLDFTSSAQGFYPELEALYGCTDADTPCAVLSATEITAALALELNLGAAWSDDRLGHGTHVASLAAGNGSSDAAYRGVAPEATLVVARVSESASDVQDGDILIATQFVFDRAFELDQPAVVNLSLGGDFGPHDGSTLLEAALAEMVGEPGRAIVVAAGNSAETITEPGGFISLAQGGVIGIHAEVAVEGDAKVTVVVPGDSQKYSDSTILVWVDTQPGDEIAVGVSNDAATVVEAVPVGYALEGETKSWDALVSNEAVLEDPGLEDYQNGALVILTGAFRADETIDITLEGTGAADLWVQSTGGLGFSAGNIGALLRGARKGGTISVPATSPALIAVGATLNRATWPTRRGNEAALSLFSESLDDTPGTVAFFSSLGPNQLGALKPDILAPGAVVIGAMAPSADPDPAGAAENAASMFSYSPICDVDPQCAVVSERYGVALGTSMAAPVVTGAVALLLQVDPTLTQQQILQLLRSGATRQVSSKTEPKEESGLASAPGLLDVARSLNVLEQSNAAQVGPEPSAEFSWLSLADTFIAPGGTLAGYFRARTQADLPADVPTAELSLTVDNAEVTTDLVSVAPGLYEFTVQADDSSEPKPVKISVKWDKQLLAEAEVPTAVDIAAVRDSGRPSSPSGGSDDDDGICAVGGVGREAAGSTVMSLVVFTTLLLSRRRRGKMTR